MSKRTGKGGVLTAEDIRLILDKIGRAVVVKATRDFNFDIIMPYSHGYHSDKEIAVLQGKLSIMLEMATKVKK